MPQNLRINSLSDLPPHLRERNASLVTVLAVENVNAAYTLDKGVLRLASDAREATFTAHLTPIGKPRMTRRDKWAKRDCVVKYFAACDELRNQVPFTLPEKPLKLHVTAYIPMPLSWSQKKQDAHRGQPHRQKPDTDNISKFVMDALFENDETIYSLHAEKYWCEQGEERLEITVS